MNKSDIKDPIINVKTYYDLYKKNQMKKHLKHLTGFTKNLRGTYSYWKGQ